MHDREEASALLGLADKDLRAMRGMADLSLDRRNTLERATELLDHVRSLLATSS